MESHRQVSSPLYYHRLSDDTHRLATYAVQILHIKDSYYSATSQIDILYLLLLRSSVLEGL